MREGADLSQTFNFCISGMTFRVNCLYKYTGKVLKPYWIEEMGENVIDISQDDIDREREICREDNKSIDPSMQLAPDHILEPIALLRKLANYITDYNRILMHGSAIAVNGQGYIFTAVSGTGKSTHTSLLRQLHGENAVMINDDKPFLCVDDGRVYVCGTPWMGKHNLGNNIMVPLEGIFFLRRSEENVLNKIKPMDAVSLMISQCHRPSDPIKMMNTLDLIDQVLGYVPLYDFGCNMDISAAELSSSVMEKLPS